jgi:predicted DNA-binding transcriptional regulator AlpA
VTGLAKERSADILRMTTREVCALARYSSSTLWKRIKQGRMPPPVDRGGGGHLFNRRAVLMALGTDAADEPAAILVQPDAFRAALARDLRSRKGEGWRDR